jgi:hypothetical protein
MANNYSQTTTVIVQELQQRVAALTMVWPPAVGGAAVPAFDRVDVFDSENLVEAFRFLLVSEQRVCLIVPLDEDLEAKAVGLKLIVTRKRPIALLVTDRVLGDRRAAVFGSQAADAAATPGALNLAEMVLPAVTGRLLDAVPQDGGLTLSKVIGVPTHCGVFTVHDPKQELQGNRACALVQVDCEGGRLEAVVGPGATF